ncbi:hypothetical protein PMSD_19205 [Paenibacillus macquariensis subsp. defensor]|nr:hypothetical protein PMSD_19205 [Paenibacillus macquariensis subsp. defensor]
MIAIAKLPRKDENEVKAENKYFKKLINISEAELVISVKYSFIFSVRLGGSKSAFVCKKFKDCVNCH